MDRNRILQSILMRAAMDYREAGLCPLPARRSEKRPAVAWKKYQERLPNSKELCAWFSNGHDAICVIAGAVSGNLEMIDFDQGGELFDAWCERVDSDLLSRLVIEKSQSGGLHAVYRCQGAVSGNLKLAQRKSSDEVITLIETRGDGGLFLCAPSPDYELIQGSLIAPPLITDEERESLLLAAWELNEHWIEAEAQVATSDNGHGRPGDEFNERGDVCGFLMGHGWRISGKRSDGNQHWTRPGKSRGTSATLKDRTFYVFSSNAHPFEPNTAYPPFAVYTLLEHVGDFAAAASALRAEGFGGDELQGDVDLGALIASGNHTVVQDDPPPPDPGPLPTDMLRIPGFISELMDFCLETAPYPNEVMAFCGALALQALLAGRKVRDPGDNRTNLYLLGLAHSAAGKDWPRKLNVRVLHEIGMSSCVGERFASGEGIQDALFLEPNMLFQTDEIDGMLQSINKSRDARHESIMSTLLTMYSSANSVFPMRRKAGKESPGAIDQPCLTIFGTAIPNHYYEALSERMLTNGFFARMLILECGKRGAGQEPTIRGLPERVLDTAHWWRAFQPNRGNLGSQHPVPAIVPHTPAASDVFAEARREADAEYEGAERRSDAVGTTVWGRVSEQARKLALIYAVSENHREPEIGGDAASWAVRLARHQTQRMLYMARMHVADTPFQGECLRLMKKLRDAPGKMLSHSMLLKRMKIDARAFQEIITTLEQRGDVAITTMSTSGRPHRCYQLLDALTTRE